jgi:superoxide reductase
MNRRTLLQLALASATTAVLVPQPVFARSLNPLKSPLAGSIYYTKEVPGRWAGKEGGHVPKVERSGNMIEVTTGHEMNGFVHYIIKHVILDENLGFVSETMFNPEKDSPVSQHDISGLENVVYAISLCNKHDAWLNALEL